MKYFLALFYESYCSLIFTHNIEKSLRLHEFEMPIMTAPLFVYPNDSIMFSFNYSRIDENKKNIFGNNAFDEVKLKNYYNNYVVKNMLSTIKGFFLKYFNNELFLFSIIFEKAVKEIMETIYPIQISQISPSNENAINKLIEENCGFYSTINYANSKFALLSHDVKGFSYYETTIVDNYLYYVHNKLSQFLNISFIPLYAENNTIMSPELCLSFLLKQLNYQVDQNKINELYRDMIKGQSTIEKCFIDKNIFDEQLEIKDISVSNEYISFLNVSNVINQGLIEIDGNPYYFIKYSYPNIVSLLEFSSDYILLDQINFYLFISFKEPEEIVHSIFIVYKNCFLLITIIFFYTWIILLVLNLFIYRKIIIQLTEPITKLQEAIESSSIKDENIFIYEYDDIIQELFLTAKELLSGQIDKNSSEKGLNQFNILSIPKDKQKNIDKNIYQKNLIIDNDLMNELIQKQQEDFSKDIKINEDLDGEEGSDDDRDDSSYMSEMREDDEEKKSLRKSDKNVNDFNDNLKKIKQNKIREEIEDKEPYKELFKIVEYLTYHVNKTEENYVHIVNNEIKDESKRSIISKINSNNNINSQLTSKLKKDIIKGDNDEMDNFTINMLNNKNISFLWYMIEKRKKTKSIYYYIGKNYDELFMDDNAYQEALHDFIESNKIIKEKKKHRKKA